MSAKSASSFMRFMVVFTDLKPRVTFVTRGTIHNDEQSAGANRAYVFELKQAESGSKFEDLKVRSATSVSGLPAVHPTLFHSSGGGGATTPSTGTSIFAVQMMPLSR